MNNWNSFTIMINILVLIFTILFWIIIHIVLERRKDKQNLNFFGTKCLNQLKEISQTSSRNKIINDIKLLDINLNRYLDFIAVRPKAFRKHWKVYKMIRPIIQEEVSSIINYSDKLEYIIKELDLILVKKYKTITETKDYDKVSSLDLKNLLISIIIPMYNEENAIKNVINKIPKSENIEIIIVDDGSSDNSVSKVKETKREINLIQLKKNRGYSLALLAGIKNARGDIIITMDADGLHDPREIFNLIKPIIDNKADIVIGSGYLGKYNSYIPTFVRIGEIIIDKILWLLFGQKVKNNLCRYRAFKKDISSIFEEIKEINVFFTTELLFKAAHNKFKIKEIPLTTNVLKYGFYPLPLIKTIISIFRVYFELYLKKHNLDLNQLSSNKLLNKIIHPFIPYFMKHEVELIKKEKVKKYFKVELGKEKELLAEAEI